MEITQIEVFLPKPNGWDNAAHHLVNNITKVLLKHEKKWLTYGPPNNKPLLYDDEDHETDYVRLTPCKGDTWTMDVEEVRNAFEASGFKVTITTESAPEKID